MPMFSGVCVVHLMHCIGLCIAKKPTKAVMQAPIASRGSLRSPAQMTGLASGILSLGRG